MLIHNKIFKLNRVQVLASQWLMKQTAYKLNLQAPTQELAGEV